MMDHDEAGLLACAGCGEPADEPHTLGCKVGLVAPSWSDSGDVPVGEVTELTWAPVRPYPVESRDTTFRVVWTFPGKTKELPSDPNAKPAMSALSKVAGESYRGLGWCDER